MWQHDNKTGKLLDRLAESMKIGLGKGYKAKLAERLGVSVNVLSNWVKADKATYRVLIDAVEKYNLPMDILRSEGSGVLESDNGNGHGDDPMIGGMVIHPNVLDLVPSSRRYLERMNFFAQQNDTEMVFTIFKALCADAEKVSPFFFQQARPRETINQR